MEKAIAQLIRDLKAEDPHIRFAAARILGELGKNSVDTNEALIESLQDTVWFVRLAALQSLKELNRLNPDTISKYIIPLLKDGHEDVREYAALVIGSFREKAKDAVVYLAEALQDPVWYVRARVAQAIGQIGSEARSVCFSLLQCLADEEIAVRLSALEALGLICVNSDNKVVDALKDVLSNEAQPLGVKKKAEIVLKKITNKTSS